MESLNGRERAIAIAVIGVSIIILGAWMSVSRRSASGSTISSSQLDAQLVRRLQANGIETSPMNETGNYIDAAAAIDAARTAGFGGSAGKGVPSLVLFTDTTYGPSNGEGGISPTFVKVPTWAVTFYGIDTPILGPSDVRGGTYGSNLIVFIDARSGKYMSAIAFGAT